jgi:hypothetical protein
MMQTNNKRDGNLIGGGLLKAFEQLWRAPEYP